MYNGDCILAIIQDAEPPYEATFHAETIFHTNYVALIIGICLLSIFITRYSVKYGVKPGYNQLHKLYRILTKERWKKFNTHLFEVITIDENRYEEGSFEYFYARFKKEHPYMWKKTRKTAGIFLVWMYKEQMKKAIDSTPIFGYRIKMNQRGLPMLNIYRLLREVMESYLIWD